MWHAFVCFFFDARKQGAGAVGLLIRLIRTCEPSCSATFVWRRRRKAEANNVVGTQFLGAEITLADQAEKINAMKKLDNRIGKQIET